MEYEDPHLRHSNTCPYLLRVLIHVSIGFRLTGKTKRGPSNNKIGESPLITS